jgi:pyruvate dehydrogenase E2 component (dihydrolipoamide acetyltransferase)
MATEVILPRVDMDMAVGKIGQWFFDEGARVEKGQPLFEIETDKAAMEIEAPASGVLRGVIAAPGDELPVGSVVGWIYAPDEAYEGPPAAADPGVGEAPKIAEETPRSTPRERPAAEASTGLRATPMARRLAREQGVDLKRLGGASGPNGRIQAKDVAAPQTPFIATEDRALHRVWLSHGEGAPFVFLHGFGADLNAWRPLLGALTGARSALALDLPGHGRSPLGGEARFEAIVDAVEATLAAEKLGALHLVGHSLGAAVAGAIAGRAASAARSLTLLAPAGLGPEINDAFLAGFLRARSEASLAPWIALLANDEGALGSALVKTTLRQRADFHVGAAQEKIAAALFPDGAQAFSIRHLLCRLAMPAKIIFGLDDRIIPPHHARGLPGVIALHLFANIGHMPHFEARAEVARLIENAAAGG